MKLVTVATIAFLFSLFMQNAFAEGSWSVNEGKDKMTGDTFVYAISDTVGSSYKLSFPYDDLESWVGFGCNKKGEWLYIGFTSSPILTNDKTKSGYSVVTNRVKYDDSIVQVEFFQKWGGKSLGFVDSGSNTAKIIDSKTMLLELEWYGLGSVYFEYPLVGSSDEINKARKICASK